MDKLRPVRRGMFKGAPPSPAPEGDGKEAKKNTNFEHLMIKEQVTHKEVKGVSVQYGP